MANTGKTVETKNVKMHLSLFVLDDGRVCFEVLTDEPMMNVNSIHFYVSAIDLEMALAAAREGASLPIACQ